MIDFFYWCFIRKYGYDNLNDNNGIIITNIFWRILDKSKRKQNKTWLEGMSDFYNRSMNVLQKGIAKYELVRLYNWKSKEEKRK